MVNNQKSNSNKNMANLNKIQLLQKNYQHVGKNSYKSTKQPQINPANFSTIQTAFDTMQAGLMKG